MLTIASKTIEPMQPSMGRRRIGIDIVIADAAPSDADVVALMEREAREALHVTGADEALVEVYRLGDEENSIDGMSIGPCNRCGTPVGYDCDSDYEVA